MESFSRSAEQAVCGNRKGDELQGDDRASHCVEEEGRMAHEVNFQNKASDALARYHERSLFDCNLITPSSIRLFTDFPSTFRTSLAMDCIFPTFL